MSVVRVNKPRPPPQRRWPTLATRMAEAVGSLCGTQLNLSDEFPGSSSVRINLGWQKAGVAAFSQLRRFCSVTRLEERSKASESGERQGASRRLKRRDLLAIPAASALPLTTLLQRNKTGATRNPLQHRIFARPAWPPGPWSRNHGPGSPRCEDASKLQRSHRRRL